MGTKEGGLRAARTNKKLYGDSVYVEIGRMGGLTRTDRTHNKGFASNPELAKIAGAKGGKISKRTKK